jgi:photosystem II stability/assembly factor-like uncharacterized protein
LGIWKTSNYQQQPATFAQLASGHEETVPTGLSCPPSGPELLVAEMDVDGFAFSSDSLATYPKKQLGLLVNGRRSWNGYTNDIAFEEGDPRNLVRAGGQSHTKLNLSFSNDGGETWEESVSFATAGLAAYRVAMSADDPANVVALCSGTSMCTADGGRTWSPCSGLPESPKVVTEYYATRPLASDSVRGGTFYYYNAGVVYRSADKGATWAPVSVAGVLPNLPTIELRCRPGAPGDLWLSEEQDKNSWQNLGPLPTTDGLYHSPDGGVTWTKVPNIARAITFSFGKAAPGGPNSLFFYGRLIGDTMDKIYWSTDSGRHWVDIQDPKNPIGNNPWYLEGSRQTYGRVFVATGGRGALYCDAAR